MTVTTVEPTTIEHLDWQLTCEYYSCRHAPPPATNIAIWHCHSIMLCADSVESLNEILHSRWTIMKCHKCQSMIEMDKVRIEPLT